MSNNNSTTSQKKETIQKNCETKLSPEIQALFMVSNFVNLIALVYSMYTWYSKKDFSFVNWIVIAWSLLSNIISIFVHHRLSEIYGNTTNRNAAIMFTIVWIGIALLKGSIEGFSM